MEKKGKGNSLRTKRGRTGDVRMARNSLMRVACAATCYVLLARAVFGSLAVQQQGFVSLSLAHVPPKALRMALVWAACQSHVDV